MSKKSNPKIKSSGSAEFVPSEGLMAAIDAKIDADKAPDKDKMSRSETATEKLPKPEVQGEDDPDPEKGDGNGDGENKGDADEIPAEIPDSQIERAVKAGMSISDARSFKDAKALERVTAILEKRSEPEKKDEKPPESSDAVDYLKLVADIPDEFDPEVYDENFIKLAKTFKSVVGGLQAEVVRLREAGMAKAEQSWFDGQVSGLGDEVVKALDADKKSNLETKFKVLEAGYKAAGQTVKREEVFKEAAKLVLGDVSVKENGGVDRSKQFISRPAGNRVVAKGEPEDEVVADIRKYKERKGLAP